MPTKTDWKNYPDFSKDILHEDGSTWIAFDRRQFAFLLYGNIAIKRYSFTDLVEVHTRDHVSANIKVETFWLSILFDDLEYPVWILSFPDWHGRQLWLGLTKLALIRSTKSKAD